MDEKDRTFWIPITGWAFVRGWLVVSLVGWTLQFVGADFAVAKHEIGKSLVAIPSIPRVFEISNGEQQIHG